jgi:ADP-ribosyl-[dinitrogen reductase] hydrolase
LGRRNPPNSACQSLDEIRCNYPEGVRELADGGTWNTIAGQPTDDSEMARLLTERGIYDSEAGLNAYQL